MVSVPRLSPIRWPSPTADRYSLRWRDWFAWIDNFDVTSSYLWLGVGVALAIAAVVVVLSSRARFFWAANGILASEFGFLLFDTLRASGGLPDGTFFGLEVLRGPHPAVQVTLDLRRPSRV